MSDEQEIDRMVRVMQVITMALLAGPTLFLGVTLFILFNQSGGSSGDASAAGKFLTMVGVPWSIGVAIAGVVLQRIIVSRGIRGRTAVSEKLAVVQRGLLVRLALSEGAALFGLVTLLMGRNVVSMPVIMWANLIPLFILYVVSAMCFPSKSAVLMQLNAPVASSVDASRYRK